jgi:hypothetical protein
MRLAFALTEHAVRLAVVPKECLWHSKFLAFNSFYNHKGHKVFSLSTLSFFLCVLCAVFVCFVVNKFFKTLTVVKNFSLFVFSFSFNFPRLGRNHIANTAF